MMIIHVLVISVVMIMLLSSSVHAYAQERTYKIQFIDPDGKAILVLRIPEAYWNSSILGQPSKTITSVPDEGIPIFLIS